MKFIAFLFIALPVADLYAQPNFPYDSISHQVVFSQSFKLNTKVKTEDIYASALAWFGEVPKFTNKNGDPPIDTIKAKKNKRKTETEELFDNPRPLQMQDPISGKVLGMGIVRYYGSMNSCIKLLYIKYDIGVLVQEGTATVSVSNVHYFHYHPSSYKQVPLYKFTGGRPCEEVGTLESLIGCETFQDEFKSFALYYNKEINGHFDDFRNMLKQKKYLYDPKAASASPAKAKSAGAPLAKKK